MGCNCGPSSFIAKPTDVTSRQGHKSPYRLGINCFCGMLRTLPTGLNINEIFTLVPCPKCGMVIKGLLIEDGVLEITI